MKQIQSIQIDDGSREEILPGFEPDFPYIASYVDMGQYAYPGAPWHWHRAVELFYMEKGTLEYTTPKGKRIFPAGSGGFVNYNVLHTSRVVPSSENAVQLLHLIDPIFLSGGSGSRMESKYILPLTAASGIEVIPLDPDDPDQNRILQLLRESFELPEEEWGYELRLREALSRIWLLLLEQTRSAPEQKGGARHSDDTIKNLMVYVHEHYAEPISVEELARQAHISRRSCFRLFQENLHMTPVEYIRSYRLRQACRLLENTRESITRIAYSCGLGSSSYFGKLFREEFGCTPLEYRKQWHDRKKNGQK